MSHWNRHYKHLLEPDIALLLDFQVDHFSDYISWTYDLRIGPGRDPGPEFADSIRQMAIDLSRRRIDCLAETPDRIDLIEICDCAHYRTIGQLPIYAAHYQTEFKPTKPVRTCILCRSIPEDLEIFCLKNGYQTWIYPDEPRTTTELTHTRGPTT